MNFGAELRRRRRSRGMSQLTLADLAGTGQRHLSYLERGLARPGRSLVLRLAVQLGLSPAERDELLLAAGLAPEPEPETGGPPVEREALEAVLKGYLPAPALIIDPDGGVVAANEAVVLLTEGSEPGSVCRLLESRDADARRGFGAPLRLRSLRGELRLLSVITSLAAAEPSWKGYLLKTLLPADARTAELLRRS
ncbi:helix-turn-helix domain-containing protein [Nonomuraea soli]|uniref:Transcriptional regulator with XRE-family HTH domain n=1 Tax=Nonomuraea soli TaxID=1032476 RepID=A0A7W0CK03_9ACTN|nr:helix-turn-helix transcriptional regulator [Nonomuraea soli]MBA2892340.1 transcriptional regulator with XRE-family HTH domain [Nonomuraea soli]